jgi:hypothetical protein
MRTLEMGDQTSPRSAKEDLHFRAGYSKTIQTNKAPKL